MSEDPLINAAREVLAFYDAEDSTKMLLGGGSRRIVNLRRALAAVVDDPGPAPSDVMWIVVQANVAQAHLVMCSDRHSANGYLAGAQIRTANDPDTDVFMALMLSEAKWDEFQDRVQAVRDLCHETIDRERPYTTGDARAYKSMAKRVLRLLAEEKPDAD